MEEIISKYLNHVATEQELALLEAWMNESPENKEMVLRLKNEFVLSSLMDRFEGVADEVQERPLDIKKAKRISFRPFLKYASIVVGAGLFTLSALRYMENHKEPVYQMLTVEEGERAKIVLADGSEIWLNSNTQISYPDNFNRVNRDIKLSGEAYFKVAKNQELPFVINTQNIEVEVVGTEFNVRSYEDDATIDVQVVEGKVLVREEDVDQQSHLLTANEMITYDKLNASFNEESFDAEVENWREGKYIFKHKTLKEIARQLERIYAVEFIINDTALLDDVYYGEINVKDSIENIMEIISLSDQFTYEIKNKQVIISNN
ncbi:MAG: FecR family protein [Bacteroidales bacterium]